LTRVKQHRHDKFRLLDNCLEQPLYLKGKWNQWFPTDQPLYLELGCGKAELSVGLATLFPQRNFLAIDLKSDRLCRGADQAIAKGLSNIGFVRMDILDIAAYFEPQSIAGIWITFPDPYPRDRDEKKRLTQKTLLNLYFQLLQSDGDVRMKSDNDGLIAFTLAEAQQLNLSTDIYTPDLHNSAYLDEQNSLLTRFEQKFLNGNKNIHYLRLTHAGQL
jgi:tRNA (guanine-N7-)-methyltransferase